MDSSEASPNAWQHDPDPEPSRLVAREPTMRQTTRPQRPACMYLDFYGLQEAPFSITPDPRFVYLSERHRDGLAHLLYGVGQGGSGGFVQLTGEVGTGKTTLCRLLLEQLPDQTRVALVLNPKLNPIELLQTICEELRVDFDAGHPSLKSLTDGLNAFLLDAHARGERVVVIIDEAQQLSVESLEQVRLLTNLETAKQKLLQIILLGQPELRSLLERPDLRQLAQRVTARYHLTPLSREESETYIRHRLEVAGCDRIPFTRLALRALHQRAQGIPRLLNIIADRALVAGYARSLDSVNERIVHEAADEALYGGQRAPWWRRWAAGIAALALIASAVALWPQRDTEPEAQASVPETAAPASTPEAVPAPDFEPALRALDPEDHSSYARLLEVWTQASGPESVAALDRCNGPVLADLHCLRGTAPLSRIKQLARPVVLRLRTEQGVVSALLLGHDGSNLQLEMAGQRFLVPSARVELHWQGDYRIVYRAPSGLPTVMRRGDQGPAVAWLRERLREAEVQLGLDALSEASDVFDEECERRLRRLQIRLGLLADGIAGPETQMVLASFDGAGPRLERATAGGA